MTEISLMTKNYIKAWSAKQLRPVIYIIQEIERSEHQKKSLFDGVYEWYSLQPMLELMVVGSQFTYLLFHNYLSVSTHLLISESRTVCKTSCDEIFGVYVHVWYMQACKNVWGCTYSCMHMQRGQRWALHAILYCFPNLLTG